MTWRHPHVLLLVPVALIGAWLLFRGRRGAGDDRLPNVARRWADRLGLHAVAPVSARGARGLALGLAAALALVALARPQWGELPEQTVARGREVMIALDLSQSMLADDVSPNRLARAKLLADALLDQLRGERVGLTVFAGTAFVQSPLSADYEVLREFLAALEPSYLPQGGTDYAAMLRAAGDAFGAPGDGDRYLVVLSDGEAHDDAWRRIAPALRERGVRVIGLGVGTPAGALVPAPGGGVLKDEDGNAVLSRLEPSTLRQLAEQTGGTYRDAATWVDIAGLVGATVAQGRAGDFVEERSVRLRERFQWFLAPALILFLLSYWLELPLTPLARALSTRGRRPHRASAPAIAAVLLGLVAWQRPDQALAAATDVPPPPSVAAASQPPDLTATIAELSARAALAAPDYERLATDTIGFAAQPGVLRGPAREGVIDDALAAVDRGERQDAGAADWPDLRRQLAALRQPPEQPQRQPQEEPQRQQGQPDQPRNHPGRQQDQQSQQGGGGPGQDEQQAGGHAQGERAGDRQARGDVPPGSPRPEAEAETDGRDSAAPAGESDGRTEAAGVRRSGDERPAGEVAREPDARPLDAAGLGDERPPAEQAPAAPPMRMVGGGQATTSAPASDDPATADALARMAQVKKGDAPAVLFERMNRAEGEPRSVDNGKSW